MKRRYPIFLLAAACALPAPLCARSAPPAVPSATPQAPPSDLFGPLFEAVQNARVFPDMKTFTDALPKDDPARILMRFRSEKPRGAAALKAFVEANFTLPADAPAITLRQHIQSLWPVLTRPALAAPKGSSALSLPATYVVPGGRFREIYYWDSYFTMLGLVADHRQDLVDSMLENFTSLIERYGFIPNGTRTYYLSRSQPPFFAAMAALRPLGDAAADARLLRALKAEHAFWMHGRSCLPAAGPGACENVVRLPGGAVLNRYWDARDRPRDEAFTQDIATARASPRPPAIVYRDLRAAAESGWDFSSRWTAQPGQLSTIHTTEIVPVDLNSLLWQLEKEIARRAGAAGDRSTAASFEALAQARGDAISRYLWSAPEARFGDYDTRTASLTPVLSAATFYPLWTGLATPEQAQAVAATGRDRLLAMGGLRTTLSRTGEQWDSPNGWAPLQWIAIDGLARYHRDDLARDIARRWLTTVDRTWRATGKLLEKYDVEELKSGGGGEYPTQDGFGWTNGVTSALLQRYPDLTPPGAVSSSSGLE